MGMYQKLMNILEEWGDTNANLSSLACRERIVKEILEVIEEESK